LNDAARTSAEHEAKLRAEHARSVRLIAKLEGDFDGVVEAAKEVATDDEHDPEGATIGYERAQVMAVLAMARSQLAELDLALARVADGTYPRCQACGGPIGTPRLDAQPIATTCVTCASLKPRHLRGRQIDR
jgi:DnaK suppressor protein